jgi:hypothetical protein
MSPEVNFPSKGSRRAERKTSPTTSILLNDVTDKIRFLA